MSDYRSTQKEQADLLRSMPELLPLSMMADSFSDFTGKAEEEMKRIFSTKENVVNLMEILRKEDWRQMRAYLTVLKEHLAWLDLGKQEIILGFLSDLLSHRSGMVRRIAARTYGYLLAYRQKEYEMSPDQEIQRVLFPGAAVSYSERRKINYQLKYLIKGFREIADEAGKKQLLNYYAGFFKSSRWDKVTCFYLIMGIIDIPCNEWSNLQKFHIFSFLRNNINRDDEEVRLAALYLIVTWLSQGWKLPKETADYLKELSCDIDAKYCERFLVGRIHSYAGSMDGEEDQEFKLELMDIMSLFRENQHSHAVWINKIINLSILKEFFFHFQETGQSDHPYCFQYASHLINTLRLNKQAVVFLQAGNDLMESMPYLESEQKFEIVKDILQSLEHADDYYNFMAPFAGRAFLYLEPADQQELLPRLWELADRSDPLVVNTTLEVVSEIIRNFYTDVERFSRDDPEEKIILTNVGKNLCSILSTGMASYKPRIAREAFFLTGQNIFAHVDLSDPLPCGTLLRLARKALISLNRKKAYADDFYNYSAVSYIRENLARNASLISSLEKPRKVAFFSGSFDPFSRGHKAIAREVAEMGYTVYLDAHDFSWYKKLQPKEIRRQIIYLSISDLENVMLFPDEYPISFENPDDLAFLRSLFPETEVTIVTGSDMIESCEAYWKEAEENSIHSFPHIIVQRGEGVSKDLVDPLIHKETIFLRVPSYFDTMTSANIQKQIALGRDISDMVDHQVKNYVLDKKLYRSEPVYKKIARTRAVDFHKEEAGRGDFRLFMTETIKGSRKTLCSITWHERGVSDLYEDCGSFEETQKLRQYVSGKILVITGLYREDGTREPVPYDGENIPVSDCIIVCNELLASYQKDEFAYGVYFDPSPAAARILERFGFIKVPEGSKGCYYVDLRHPLTLFYDVESYIKEPYCRDRHIREAIAKGKDRLQKMLPKIYPGSLLLHFEAPVINYRLSKLITKANQVPGHPVTPVDEEGTPLSYEAFGEKMCVPFGKLLKGVLIPNTVTKELNIEKLYERDLNSFDVREFPDYEPLRTQIRTVKAFRRPAIFVDDLYHKGYRMQKISRLLKEEDIKPDRFMVGVLSGQGRNLAREYQLEVEAPYFIPDMRAWIVESDLYPFLGGDGITTEEEKREGIVGLPSINPILPYEIPKFLQGTNLTQIYELSETAINNAREIFLALEALYRQEHYHTLTFGRIGEVMAEPRYPEDSIAVRHNDLAVSELLSAELGKLHRLRSITLFDR